MKTKGKPQAVEPSPLPWRIVAVKDHILVKAPEGCRIAELHIPRGDLNNANARLIVRAVNLHAALVALLKDSVCCSDGCPRCADYDVRKSAALRAAGEAV